MFIANIGTSNKFDCCIKSGDAHLNHLQIYRLAVGFIKK